MIYYNFFIAYCPELENKINFHEIVSKCLRSGLENEIYYFLDKISQPETYCNEFFYNACGSGNIELIIFLLESYPQIDFSIKIFTKLIGHTKREYVVDLVKQYYHKFDDYVTKQFVECLKKNFLEVEYLYYKDKLPEIYNLQNKL